MFANIFPNFGVLPRAKAFRSACLIFNPVAGQGDAQQELARIKEILETQIELDIQQTTPEIDADELARQAVARQVELVIASGGDGTLSKAANALTGSTIPLAVIPRGTANAFANALGLPTNIDAACQMILQGATKTIGTGRCNGQSMLLLAGIGFEAETVAHADREAKDKFGLLAYILAGLQQLQQLPTFETHIETDDKQMTLTAAAITVANVAPPTSILAQGTGGFSPQDGLLDVTIITPDHAIDALTAAVDLLSSGLIHTTAHHSHIGYFRTKQITITANPPQKIALDGEIIGTTPVTIEAVPSSLTILVPFEQLELPTEKLAGLKDVVISESGESNPEPIAIPSPLSNQYLQALTDAITQTQASLNESLNQALQKGTQSLQQVSQQIAENTAKAIAQTQASLNEGVNLALQTGSQSLQQVNQQIGQTASNLGQTVSDSTAKMGQAAQDTLKNPNKLAETGSNIAGGMAGQAVGEVIGGTIGGVVMGPGGVFLGAQLGGFAGEVAGGLAAQKATRQILSPEEATLEIKAKEVEDAVKEEGTEQIGGTFGKAAGTIVGGAFGPLGQNLGKSVGGILGGVAAKKTLHKVEQAAAEQAKANLEIEEKIYEVIHQVPGRMRLRIPRLHKESDYGDRLKTLVESWEGVTEIRLNPSAASLSITYIETTIPQAQLQERLIAVLTEEED